MNSPLPIGLRNTVHTPPNQKAIATNSDGLGSAAQLAQVARQVPLAGQATGTQIGAPSRVLEGGSDLLPGTIPVLGAPAEAVPALWVNRLDALPISGVVHPLGPNLHGGFPGAPGFQPPILPAVVPQGKPPGSDWRPWPCGPLVSVEVYDYYVKHAAEIVGDAVDKLSGASPWGAANACKTISAAIAISPKAALTALRNKAARFLEGDSRRDVVARLIECAEAASDFQGVVDALTTSFKTAAEQDTPTEDPCARAMGALKTELQYNPQQAAARMLALANSVRPSNQLSRNLVAELREIAGSLALFGGTGATATMALMAIRRFYDKLVNGTLCDCTIPASPIERSA